MIYRLNYIKRRVFLLCALCLFTSVANASYIVVNDGLVSQKVLQKINSLGEELFLKTKVSVYVAAPKSLNKKTIKDYEQELTNGLKEPYVLLTLAKNEQKVDIINSEELNDRFDKESTLSPFPWSGTIIPLLTVKKDNDKYNAAVLNGYADIVEQIASSYNLKLDGAIGNTNKNIYHYLKIGIYGFLIFIILRYFYRLKRRKND